MPVDFSHEPFQVSSSSDEERHTWFDRFRTGPVAFHTRTKRLDVEPHGGPFSIKAVFHGSETYHFANRRVRVAPGEILIVAPETIYASSINTPVETNSFAVFIPGHLLGGNCDSQIGRFLDRGLGALNLVGQLHLHQCLANLSTALEEDSELAIDEGFTCLLNEIGLSCGTLGTSSEKIDARKPARRAELLRRVLRAKALIDADPCRALPLADLATEACLSPYHLLRVFKAAFGKTPGQYLTARRMERAGELLAAGREQTIAAVANDCGYSNPSAFARAFRRHWGHAPVALHSVPLK